MQEIGVAFLPGGQITVEAYLACIKLEKRRIIPLEEDILNNSISAGIDKLNLFRRYRLPTGGAERLTGTESEFIQLTYRTVVTGSQCTINGAILVNDPNILNGLSKCDDT